MLLSSIISSYLTIITKITDPQTAQNLQSTNDANIATAGLTTDIPTSFAMMLRIRSRELDST